MGQVTTMGKIQAHDRIAGPGKGQIDGLVGRRARVGLDVDVLGAEQFTGSSGAQFLQAVDLLLALVIAFARIPLRILVGENGTSGFQHCLAGVVFRGNQADFVVLTAILRRNYIDNLWIDFMEIRHNPILSSIFYRFPCQRPLTTGSKFFTIPLPISKPWPRAPPTPSPCICLDCLRTATAARYGEDFCTRIPLFVKLCSASFSADIPQLKEEAFHGQVPGYRRQHPIHDGNHHRCRNRGNQRRGIDQFRRPFQSRLRNRERSLGSG